VEPDKDFLQVPSLQMLCKESIVERCGGERLSDAFVAEKMEEIDIVSTDSKRYPSAWKCPFCSEEQQKLSREKLKEDVLVEVERHLRLYHGEVEQEFRKKIFQEKLCNLSDVLLDFLSSPQGREPLFENLGEYLRQVMIESQRKNLISRSLCTHEFDFVVREFDDVEEEEELRGDVYEMLKIRCHKSEAYEVEKCDEAEAEACVEAFKRVFGTDCQCAAESWWFANYSTFNAAFFFHNAKYSMLAHVDDED
jgi:hypothetical protein